MFSALQPLFAQIGLVFASLAIGATWITAIAAPNCSFDKLDGSRADTHVRDLLRQTAVPIAVLMAIGGAGFLLGGSIGAGVTALTTAFGFLANRWMLAPRNGKLPTGVKGSRTGQRTVSVSFALMFALVGIGAIILGLVGI
jgi:hypothetical protein